MLLKGKKLCLFHNKVEKIVKDGSLWDKNSKELYNDSCEDLVILFISRCFDMVFQASEAVHFFLVHILKLPHNMTRYILLVLVIIVWLV